MIKLLYIVFMGALLALFVGFGIATFYAEPQQPKSPDLSYAQEPTAADKRVMQDYDKKMNAYIAARKPYYRTVAVIAFIAAVVFVALGILLEGRLGLLADSLMLGGLFVLVYSLVRSFASANSKFSFAVITGGLVITLALGYYRFVKPARAA